MKCVHTVHTHDIHVHTHDIHVRTHDILKYLLCNKVYFITMNLSFSYHIHPC